MNDLRTRAQLVGFDAASAGAGSIGTVISRAEFAETAAQGEFPATLLLDLDRPESGDQARVAVDWDKDTIDRLLASTDDDEIGLWFDERELASAFDDVEGHGLREKAAVLAVVVAAAGASAGPGLASPFSQVTDGSGGGATGPAVVAPQTPSEPMGVARAQQLTADVGGGGSALLKPQPGAGSRAAGTMGAVPGLDESTGSGGSAVSMPSVSSPSAGELAGLAAGAALLISAAGFGVARKRTPPAQPA